MNKKDFMKAMSMIDDDLMRDADSVTKADTPEYEESVSGVEPYRRPVWQTVTTLAASLVLVVGVGAGGTYYLTHRGAPAPEEEQIIAASTAETETTSAETDEQAEVTTVRTRKRDTMAKTTLKDAETKESTNTKPVTDPPEEGEVEGISGSDGEEHAPISTASVTKAATPVTTATAATTAVQTTAVPVQTESPQTYKVPDFYPDNPNNDPALRGYDQSALFADLASLSYSPYTCDGIPEYRLIAPDGTEYLINMSERWIWRRTPDMIGQSVEPEEAHLDLLGRQWWYLKFHGEEIGMQADIYGW